MKHLTQTQHRSIAEVLFYLINASDTIDLDANDIEGMIWEYFLRREYGSSMADYTRIKQMVDEVNRRDVTLVHCIAAVRNWIEFESAEAALEHDCRQADELNDLQRKEITGNN